MERHIEEMSMNAWPALQTMVYDGWILRFSKGYTKRANSVNPIYESSENPEKKILMCEELYKSQGLNTVFKMTSESHPEGLDDMLSQKGYNDEAYTSVQVAVLNKFEGIIPKNIVVYNSLNEKWLEQISCLSDVKEADEETLKRMISRIITEKFFVELKLEGRTAGCGMGVLQGDYLGIFDIIIDSGDRCKGYGKALVDSMLSIGKAKGAKYAYLQVLLDNEPALKLYSSLGFKEVYKYWYRVKRNM
ncbi:MAG: GNAT family N-acetyltransferase [Caulobacteraceae bacterium]